LRAAKSHRLVNQVGPKVAWALQEGPNTDPQAIPVMYVEVDATGVPMVADELAGRKGKQEDGSSKTREPNWAVSSPKPNRMKKRDCRSAIPIPLLTWAVLKRPKNLAGAFARALRRGLGRALKVVFLGDGAAWIWELARVNFPLAIWIVDLYTRWRGFTIMPGLYRDQSSWAPRMEEQWKQMLKNDQVTEVIAAARRRLKALAPPSDEALEKQIAYFENQQSRDALQDLPRARPLLRLRRGRGGLQSRHWTAP